MHVRPSFVRPGNLKKRTERIILCHFLFHFTHTKASIFPASSCPFHVRSGHFVIRDLQIGLRVRDWVRVRLFNSSFQASHYHNTYPFHPMSHSLNLKSTWRTRALETSLVWISKIVLVLNLVLVVQSKAPYLFLPLVENLSIIHAMKFFW